MSIDIILERIRSYSPLSLLDEENAVKEIYQEIALSGLSRSGFFKVAGFQGGTCLRILYDLNRFSEDLDFILIDADKTFSWGPYLNGIRSEFEIYGIQLEIIDRGKADKTIQKAILKDDSFTRVFQLSYKREKSNKQTICIKFEIDTNPPKFSAFETHYLDFPLPFQVICQDKASLFGSKCHALLCRPFLKGRDWYDFLWYVGNKSPINLEHLKSALIQTGHWRWDSEEPMSKQKISLLLHETIEKIDWRKAAADVAPLLKPIDRDTLKGWSQEFFLSYVSKLNHYLKGPLQKAVIFRIADGPAPSLNHRLFSGAISEFDQDEIEQINASETFWCQTVESILSLEEEKKYEVVFLHLDHPGEPKQMAGKTHLGEMKLATYIPGQCYELPGWFIKSWANRELVHYHGIYRALYWFQPVNITPQKTIEAIQKYAKKSL